MATAKTSKKTDMLKVPAEGASYATGRRKQASARVWIFKGTGRVQVNGRKLEDYFGLENAKMLIEQPLQALESNGKYDIYCTVKGSGFSGQAKAIQHGVSRALVVANDSSEAVIKTLREGSFLTRDSRIVERKKPGLRKARRSRQFSKR